MSLYSFYKTVHQLPPSVPEVYTNERQASFFMLHGVCLWTAWCIFGLVQIFSHRYFIHKWRYRLHVHTYGGILIFVITYWYGFYGLYSIGWSVVDDFHAKFGISVISLVSVLALTAAIALWRMQKAKEGARTVTIFKRIH